MRQRFKSEGLWDAVTALTVTLASPAAASVPHATQLRTQCGFFIYAEGIVPAKAPAAPQPSRGRGYMRQPSETFVVDADVAMYRLFASTLHVKFPLEQVQLAAYRGSRGNGDKPSEATLRAVEALFLAGSECAEATAALLEQAQNVPIAELLRSKLASKLLGDILGDLVEDKQGAQDGEGESKGHEPGEDIETVWAARLATVQPSCAAEARALTAGVVFYLNQKPGRFKDSLAIPAKWLAAQSGSDRKFQLWPTVTALRVAATLLKSDLRDQTTERGPDAAKRLLASLNSLLDATTACSSQLGDYQVVGRLCSRILVGNHTTRLLAHLTVAAEEVPRKPTLEEMCAGVALRADALTRPWLLLGYARCLSAFWTEVASSFFVHDPYISYSRTEDYSGINGVFERQGPWDTWKACVDCSASAEASNAAMLTTALIRTALKVREANVKPHDAFFPAFCHALAELPGQLKPTVVDSCNVVCHPRSVPASTALQPLEAAMQFERVPGTTVPTLRFAADLLFHFLNQPSPEVPPSLATWVGELSVAVINSAQRSPWSALPIRPYRTVVLLLRLGTTWRGRLLCGRAGPLLLETLLGVHAAASNATSQHSLRDAWRLWLHPQLLLSLHFDWGASGHMHGLLGKVAQLWVDATLQRIVDPDALVGGIVLRLDKIAMGQDLRAFKQIESTRILMEMNAAEEAKRKAQHGEVDETKADPESGEAKPVAETVDLTAKQDLYRARMLLAIEGAAAAAKADLTTTEDRDCCDQLAAAVQGAFASKLSATFRDEALAEVQRLLT